jgi:hypothetical protein
MEFNGVAHVIQQAVAPVFLLTGVGAILGVLTNRLSRVVDRFRDLDPSERAEADVRVRQRLGERYREERALLSRRRVWIQRAITLCTVCALLVCLVIAVLFLASEAGMDPSRIVAVLFVAGMASLVFGLLCFLREIALAARQIDEH